MLKFPYLPLPYYFISIIAVAIHRYFPKLEFDNICSICRDTSLLIGVNLRLKPLINLVFRGAYRFQLDECET